MFCLCIQFEQGVGALCTPIADTWKDDQPSSRVAEKG